MAKAAAARSAPPDPGPAHDPDRHRAGAQADAAARDIRDDADGEGV